MKLSEITQGASVHRGKKRRALTLRVQVDEERTAKKTEKQQIGRRQDKQV